MHAAIPIRRESSLRRRLRPVTGLGGMKLAALRIDDLRKAVRGNQVSFPSPVPTFEHHDRPDLQWKLAQLYFVLGWSCEKIAARCGLIHQRVRQILRTWQRRAVETGYIQYIPPAEVIRVAPRKLQPLQPAFELLPPLPIPVPAMPPVQAPASHS